jgi:hypothetical protein
MKLLEGCAPIDPVMPGLDPGIYAAPPTPYFPMSCPPTNVDGRVKPGHNERFPTNL